MFTRSADVGKEEPSPKVIEEKRREILNRYGDGLVAHVNPQVIEKIPKGEESDEKSWNH